MNITGHGQKYCGTKYCKGGCLNILRSTSNNINTSNLETDEKYINVTKINSNELAPYMEQKPFGHTTPHGSVKKSTLFKNGIFYIVKEEDSSNFNSPEIEAITNNVYRLIEIDVPNGNMGTIHYKSKKVKAYFQEDFLRNQSGIKMVHLSSYISESDYSLKNIITKTLEILPRSDVAKLAKTIFADRKSSISKVVVSIFQS